MASDAAEKRARELVIVDESRAGNRRGWLELPGTFRGGVALDLRGDHVDLGVAAARERIASVLDQHAAEVTALRDAEIAELRALVREALDGWHTSHSMHWDREGTHGLNCPACHEDGRLRERLRAALGKGGGNG